MLASVTDTNGYRTCFTHTHFGDAVRGRVAVLSEINYGRAITDCAKLPADPVAEKRHTVRFTYEDSTAGGYYVPWSLRQGAPVIFPDLLKKVTSSALGVAQYEVSLHYELAGATETRRPRLQEIKEAAIPAGDRAKAVTRSARWYAYGNRKREFSQPQVIDLGPEGDFPASLSGAVTRPIRHTNWLGNPNGLFQVGSDQSEGAAPPAHATTEQWSLTDVNADGLIDLLWSKETGQPQGLWTHEFLSPPLSPRPSQQLAIINEGLAGKKLSSGRIVVNTQATSLQNDYSPANLGSPGFTPWIWAEGQGLTRTGMSLSVSMPELRNRVDCPPVNPDDDTRRWPVLPDGTLGGSQGSVAERIDAAIKVTGDDYPESLNNIMIALNAAAAIREPSVPRAVVSATLSGWLDLTGDGVGEFVATPAFIQRFDLPGLPCGGFARTPEPPNRATDTSDWYVASVPISSIQTQTTADAVRFPGPLGPWGLPLDYSVSSSTTDGFGITIPVSAAGVATLNALATNGYSFAQDGPALAIRAFVPKYKQVNKFG